MKVLVIGAGAVGSIIAKFLAQDKDIEGVICGDISLKQARRFMVPDPKVVLKILDASQKDAVLAAAKGCGMLVSASLPKFNKHLMQIALDGNMHYVDMASHTLPNGKIEQCDLDGKFKEKNLIGFINVGASPGVTNLMAKELTAKLKRVDYVKIRLLEDVSSDVPFTAWSKVVFFEEFATPPLVWEGDKFTKFKSFAGEEIYDFPVPFMNEKCFLVLQEEVETIPLYIKTKYVDLKIGGSEARTANMFYKLGFMKTKPMKVGSVEVPPYEFSVRVWPDVLGLNSMKKLAASGKLRNAHFWAVVEVAGLRDARKRVYKAIIKFPSQTEVNKLYPGANFISYSAGFTAALFALQIPKIERKGVFPPEALDDKTRDELIAKLGQSGIKIEIVENRTPPTEQKQAQKTAPA